MSLINDYLKKTENNTKGNHQAGDLPPVLKTIGKNSGPALYLRVASLVLLVLIAGAGLYLYRLPGKIREDHGAKKQITVTATADKIETSRPDQNIALPPEPAAVKEPAMVSLPIKELEPPETEPGANVKPVAVPRKKELPTTDMTVSSVRKQATVEKQTVNIDSYYQLGCIAQKDGRYNDAARYYNEVLNQAPAHLDALTNLTVIYIDRKHYKKAGQLIARIRKLDPSNAKSFVNEGLMLLTSGNSAAAIKAFETALKINSNEEAALTNLAYIAGQQNDIRLMERCYKGTAVPVNEIALTYAAMLEKKARYDEAVAVYAAVVNNPENKKNYQLINSIKDRVKLISSFQN